MDIEGPQAAGPSSVKAEGEAGPSQLQTAPSQNPLYIPVPQMQVRKQCDLCMSQANYQQAAVRGRVLPFATHMLRLVRFNAKPCVAVHPWRVAFATWH
jgi:hypothetical protein